MIKKSILLLLIFVCAYAKSQTIKANVLAPLSVYAEFKTKPKQTVQFGISYVPYYFNINKVSDASFIIEYRKYKPKIGSGMDKLWEKNFPRGPFMAPYFKLSRLSRLDKNTNAVYAGLAIGNKQMRLLRQPKKCLEYFIGFGLGSPIFIAAPKELKRTEIDVRFGLSLGLHYSKKEEKPSFKSKK